MKYRRRKSGGRRLDERSVLPAPAARLRLLVVATALALLSSPSLANTSGSESRVKAEFTSRFAEFASWPVGAITKNDTSFNLCVAGDGDMADTLESIAKRIRVHRKKVRVRRIRLPSNAKGCHLVYLTHTSKAKLKSTLHLIDKKPILTISGSTGFGREGVMINMYRKGKTVGFEINQAALDAAGIRMPANVLRLGRELE